MIEAFFAVLTAYMLTWPALVAVLILGIIFEHKGARGWAIFTGITAMVVSYFFFDVSFSTLLVCAAAYIAIGVVWSFWRYRVYVVERAAEIRNMKTSDSMKVAFVDDLAPSRNIDKITAWIIIWPFSAIENILGDAIRAIDHLVTSVFKGVYYRIFTSATADVFKKEEEGQQ